VLARWPNPQVYEDPKINQIHFTAQVKERAAIRAEQIEAAGGKTIVQDDSDNTWWAALLAAVALTFLGPLLVDWIARFATFVKGAFHEQSSDSTASAD
jgi:hypothetical protein